MASARGEESRRRVTAMFCDLVGSTDLVTSLDPEPLRALLSAYFEVVGGAIERHGGVVEKFIGDAVVGVFGVPRTHEDDALRAARAALEVQAALAALNNDTAQRVGPELVARIGVGTGDVLGGDATSDHGLLAGEPLNLAARLQHAAGPGEVYLSSDTYGLVSDEVEADEIGPLALAGFPAEVVAWRLERVIERPSVLTRDEVSPFVGREEQLAMLRGAALGSERCRLITVVGPAGIGKSRLVREFLQTVPADARTVVGRCLSYGDGITYWPLAEIVRGVAANRAELAELLEGEPDGDVIFDRLTGVVGWAGDLALTVEIQWAARRLLEALAAGRSVLVVVVEDLHWAETTMLDLLEYTAGIARGSMLIVGTARPELLEARPDWATIGESIVLDTLSPEDAMRVARSAGAAEAVVAGIVETADGNPLFVEQLAALGDTTRGRALPASIGGVLRARIDALPSSERAVLQTGSIEGRSFHVGGLMQLQDEAATASLSSDLAALVRKRLLRPDQPQLSGDDAYRFTHVLLREEAYESLPYQRRALLHEQLADWLETRRPELVASDELIGHHLAEAYRNLKAVGDGERLTDLGRRAGELLVGAAFRADARGDMLGALRLFDRGVALLPPDAPIRARALYVWGTIQEPAIGIDMAMATLGEAIDAGHQLGDEMSVTLTRLTISRLELETHPSSESTMRFTELTEEAIAQATLTNDEWALATAWDCASYLQMGRCHYSEMLVAAERCLAHSRRAGNARLERDATGGISGALEWGATPAPEAIRQCERILADTRSEVVGVRMLGQLAVLVAMQGERDRAYELLDRLHAIALEHGVAPLNAIRGWWYYGRIANNEGDWQGAISAWRNHLDDEIRAGHRGAASTTFAYLAQALAHVGQLDEAERLAREAVKYGSAEDVTTQCIAASAYALIESKHGSLDQAADHAQRAMQIANTTDWLTLKADVHLIRAEIRARSGDITSARASVHEALALFHAKQSLVGQERANALTASLDGRAPA